MQLLRLPSSKIWHSKPTISLNGLLRQPSKSILSLLGPKQTLVVKNQRISSRILFLNNKIILILSLRQELNTLTTKSIRRRRKATMWCRLYRWWIWISVCALLLRQPLTIARHNSVFHLDRPLTPTARWRYQQLIIHKIIHSRKWLSSIVHLRDLFLHNRCIKAHKVLHRYRPSRYLKAPLRDYSHTRMLNISCQAATMAWNSTILRRIAPIRASWKGLCTSVRCVRIGLKQVSVAMDPSVNTLMA